MRPRKHKGLATYRLATNPVERVFARRWAELHRNEGRGPLDEVRTHVAQAALHRR